MYEEIQRKEVKCRKSHFCSWCAGHIPAGNYAAYRAYVWNGDFHNDWMHDDCDRAMRAIDPSDFPDGWTPGDFERGSTVCIN